MPLPSELPLWAYGYAVTFALVHGVVLYYLYRSNASTPSADASTDVDVGSENDTVVCEHCGAENDHEYRYCRNCVQELSGAGGSAGADRGPVSRGIL